MALLDFITSKKPEDVERRLRLAQGFAGMAHSPNQPLIQGIESRLEGIREQKTANATINAMQQAGIDPKLINIARANPSLYKDIAKGLIQSKVGGGFAPQYSTPRVDPETNQLYVIKTDRNTGVSSRVDIENAYAEDPQDVLDREMTAQLKQSDTEAGYAMAADYFGKYESIRSKLMEYDKAIDALKSGAGSGVIRDFLPAFTASTSSLRQAANNLGITVINSATFGALSEQELKLALSTEVDLSLSPEELTKQLVKKRQAQAKFAAELGKKAREAQTMGRKAFIEQYTKIQEDNSQDIGSGNASAVIDAADAIVFGGNA